jgi:hypothetical protein
LTIGTASGAHGGLAPLAVGGTAARLVRTVMLPSSLSGAEGMTITHDGRLLLVAAGTATGVFSVPALEHGSHHALLGILADTGTAQTEVAVSGGVGFTNRRWARTALRRAVHFGHVLARLTYCRRGARNVRGGGRGAPGRREDEPGGGALGGRRSCRRCGTGLGRPIEIG